MLAMNVSGALFSLPAGDRVMHLPDVLDAGRVVHHLPGLRACRPCAAPLFMIATRGCRACTMAAGSGHVHAVMRGEVHVHRADLVVRAHQVVFLVPGEIAEVDDAELAERDQRAERAGVLGLVLVARLEAGAELVGLAGAFERRGNLRRRWRSGRCTLRPLTGMVSPGFTTRCLPIFFWSPSSCHRADRAACRSPCWGRDRRNCGWAAWPPVAARRRRDRHGSG